MPTTIQNHPITNSAAGNSDQGGLHLPMTNGDLKLKAARDLLSFAARINNASDVLGKIHTILNNSASTKRDKKIELKMIQKTIIPLLVSVLTKMRESVKVLSPIGSIAYVNARIDNKWKREMIDTTSPASKSEQFIRQFMQDNNSEPPSKRPALRSITNIAQNDRPSPLLPVPSKGENCRYNKSEVVAILSQVNRKSKQYIQRQNAVLAHQRKVNCPCSERTIRRLMKRHDQGLPIVGEFMASGKPAFCTDDDIQQLVKDFEERTGQV